MRRTALISASFVVLLVVAHYAHAGPIGGVSGGAGLTHPTDCTSGGVQGTTGQQCTDLDDGKLWTCKTPAAAGTATSCDAPADWLPTGFSVAGGGITSINGAAGTAQTLAGTAPVSVATNTSSNTHTFSLTDGPKGDITTAGTTWTVNSGAVTAAEVTNAPAGTITTLTVQAALNELDTLKQPADADLTTLAGKTIVGNGTTLRLSTGAATPGNTLTTDASGNIIDSGAAGLGDGDKGDITVAGPSWTVDSGAVTAAEIVNAPYSTTNTLTVQAAINELTDEKQPLSADLSEIAGLAPLNGMFLRQTGGVWTAATIANGDVPDDITINLANTATALANDPPPCTANQFVTDMAANGTLSCTPLSDAAIPDNITITIAPNSVTNQNLVDMPTATIKGRDTAGTGDPEDLTGTEATALLDLFTPANKGLVAASGGGTANFLRADGVWAPPPGGAGGGGDALTSVGLGQFAPTTSGELAGVLTDERGSATGGFLRTDGTVVVASTKTLTANNTLTFSGTDGTTMTFPATSDTVATLTATQTFTNKTLTIPNISSFVNAQHNHQTGAAGGALSTAAITSGTFTPARLGSGTPDATTFLRGDGNWVVPPSGTVSDGDKGDITITSGVWNIENGAVLASEVTNPPGGNILATNVQAAITELDTEKETHTTTLTTLGGKTVAGTGTDIRLSTGSFATNDCVKVDASGNFATAGAACGSGPGTGGEDLQETADLGRIVNNAVDVTSAVAIGGATRRHLFYCTASECVWGVTAAQDLNFTLADNFDWNVKDFAGASILNADEATKMVTFSGPVVVSGSGIEYTESDSAPLQTCSAGIFSIYADDSENKFKKCEDGVLSDVGSGTGGGGVTVPLILTPSTDGPGTLVIQNATPVTKIQLGTKVANANEGAVFFASTPTTGNYALTGTDSATTLNANSFVYLGTANVVRGQFDSLGLTVSHQLRFIYPTPDVALGRPIAGTIEINNTNAGQNAPLIVGYRDTATTTVGTGLTIRRQTPNVPAVGFGASLLFQVNSNPTANQEAARLDALWTDAATATRSSVLAVNVASGGTMVEVGRFLPTALQLGAVEFAETTTPTACSADNFNIYADTTTAKLKKCEDGVVSDLDTGGGTATDDQTLQEAFDQGKTIYNATSEANAFQIGLDDGDGNCNEAGEGCWRFWVDAAQGPQWRAVPDGHRYVDVPNGFAAIWRYNGTEAMRLTDTTVTFSGVHRPTKSVEVAGNEYGGCTYTMLQIPGTAGKPKTGVFTCTSSTSDGFDFDFTFPDSGDITGTFSVKINGYSVNASASGTVLGMTCAVQSIRDGDTVAPRQIATGAGTVSLSFDGQYIEAAGWSAPITPTGTHVAGNHIYGHCQVVPGSTTATMADVRLNAVAKVYYETNQLSE